jgi:hypothetical protein
LPYHLRKEEKIMNIRYIDIKGLIKTRRQGDGETRRYGDTVTRRHGEKGSFEVRKLGRWEN